MNVNIFRDGEPLYSVKLTDNSYVNHNLMGDETAYVEFFSNAPLDLQMGDYFYLLNHRYILSDAVVPVRESLRLKYQLTIYGTQYELEKSLFFIQDSTGVNSILDSTWSCTPLQFLNHLIVNLKRSYPYTDWRIGECLSANAKDITLSNNSCFEMLKSAAELFECDYHVDEYSISLKKIVPDNHPLNLEVGFNKGLREITANKSGDSKIITRLWAYGGTTNMPNGQRLSIPAIDAPGAILPCEGMKLFEEIYPRVECLVADVLASPYYLIIAPLGFDVSDYAIAGSDPLITFLTGQLTGLSFEFSIYDYVTGGADTGNEIIYLQQIVIEGGLSVPGPVGYRVARGDEFVISNINMPPSAITYAQQRLHTAAVSYLERVSRQKLKLNLTTDDIYFSRNNTALHLGQTLRLKSSIITFMAERGVDVNVLGFKNYINQPHRYESVIVGDVYYTRPFGTVVQVNRNETILKSSEVGTDKYYRHYQADASAEWIVNHALSKRPAVTITNESGKQMEAVVTYMAPNRLKINFSVPRTGYAECN